MAKCTCLAIDVVAVIPFSQESQPTKDTWKWTDGGWPCTRGDSDSAQCPRLFEKARFWKRVPKSSKSLLCKVWPFHRTWSSARTRVQGTVYHSQAPAVWNLFIIYRNMQLSCALVFSSFVIQNYGNLVAKFLSISNQIIVAIRKTWSISLL